MPGNYAKLRKDWLLRGWNDSPMAVANCTTGFVHQVNQKEFYVLESCDGETNFNSLAFLPEHRVLLDAFIKEGMVEPLLEKESIEPYQRYRKSDTFQLNKVHWCVTGFCNLKCRHCYMESPSGRYGELPFADIIRIIDQFEEANVIAVSLSGGEPFLRKDILKIISLLAKTKICVNSIYSNGLLITEDHLNSIKKLGFLPTFQISFDGVGAHDYMRGTKGIEKNVVDSIRMVKANGFPIVVATSIDMMNIGQLTRTYELMKDLGVTGWRVSIPQKTGNWRDSRTALPLKDLEMAYRPLLDRWIKDKKPFYLELAGFYNDGRTPENRGFVPPENMRNSPNYTSEGFDCRSCRIQINLLPDGTLLPCPGYVDSVVQERMPNILRENLSKVWTESFLREIVNLKKKDLLAKNPECGECSLFRECGMGCRASALTETGDIMAKDPVACNLWKGGLKKHFNDAVDATFRENELIVRYSN